MSAPVRIESPLCRCDRPAAECILHCVRVRGADRSGCPPRRTFLQTEHPA
jgi:hypothetical protein